MAKRVDLDARFISLGKDDPLTHRQAMESFFVTGGVGSGKSSGSGATFLRTYMDKRNNYGMCCLTVKPEETGDIEAIAQQMGRSDDVIKIAPSEPWFYAFLEAEAKREASETESIVSLFLSLVEVAQGGFQSSESYWFAGLRQLLINAVTTLQCASEAITINNVYKLVIQAPTSLHMLRSEEFQKDNYCYSILNTAINNADTAIQEGTADVYHHDFDISFLYWTKEYPNLAEKTRSIIVSMFTTSADAFLRGSLRTIFNEQESKHPCPPELAREGKIIIVDMSVKVYESVGVIANSVYKMLFQKAMERKPLKETGVATALYMDECQHFLNDYDYTFLQTSRSAGCSVFALTQSINNLITKYGENGEAKAYNLLGLIGNKIAHKNTCVRTNKYFAELIGEDWDMQSSSSIAMADENQSMTSSMSEQKRFLLESIRMTELLSGGVENSLIVEGIVHNGQSWSNGEKFLRCYFQQQ